MPKYTITLSGDGGEFIAGVVKKDFLNALEENGISIEDYAENNLDEEDYECIPEETRPFDPGCWYDIHPYIVWATLCGTDGTITVNDDETNETVFEATIHECESSDREEDPRFSIYDPGDDWSGQCVYTCMRHEDGTFFIGTLEIDQPFDPEKLILMTVNHNEVDRVSAVLYYPDGFDSEKFIEVESTDHESDINGATHELMML